MADDLFSWLDALWSKKQPTGAFPAFVAHRFLASDRALAEAARVLWRDVREPALIFRTWQALLPVGRGARRLSYPAPKKGPAAEALTVRMMAVLAERRAVAEDMQHIVAAAGRMRDLYHEFGIEAPDDAPTSKLKETAPSMPSRGLLDFTK